MPLPITASELHADEKPNVGRNAIVIAITRSDAGFLKDVLRHYGRTNQTAEHTGELCRELLDRMDGHFPRS